MSRLYTSGLESVIKERYRCRTIEDRIIYWHVYLPGESDSYCDHNDHVDETGAHKISRKHPVPFARVLQQVIKTMAYCALLSRFSISYLLLTDALLISGYRGQFYYELSSR